MQGKQEPMFSVFTNITLSSPVKRCTKCIKDFPATTEYFQAVLKNTVSGLHSWCKACLRSNKKADYIKNREKRLASVAAYRMANKEKITHDKQNWHIKNKALISCKRKTYNALHKQEQKMRYARWLHDNRSHFNEYQKQYRNKNKDRLLPKTRANNKARLATNPYFRLHRSVSRSVWGCLKHSAIEKGKNTFTLLGYSLESLILRLESLFTDGMSWENYGKWHVDHIKPVSSFCITSKEVLLQCWALENLQPLWAKDNLVKASKYHRETK